MLAPTALHDYARNSWQRSVLFLDILRQREEMLAHGIAVLIYDSELVMRGDQLPNPVNYSLLHVIPRGAEIDNRKRPVFVIDPRAGEGPGIVLHTALLATSIGTHRRHRRSKRHRPVHFGAC